MGAPSVHSIQQLWRRCIPQQRYAGCCCSAGTAAAAKFFFLWIRCCCPCRCCTAGREAKVDSIQQQQRGLGRARWHRPHLQCKEQEGRHMLSSRSGRESAAVQAGGATLGTTSAALASTSQQRAPPASIWSEARRDSPRGLPAAAPVTARPGSPGRRTRTAAPPRARLAQPRLPADAGPRTRGPWLPPLRCSPHQTCGGFECVYGGGGCVCGGGRGGYGSRGSSRGSRGSSKAASTRLAAPLNRLAWTAAAPAPRRHSPLAGSAGYHLPAAPPGHCWQQRPRPAALPVLARARLAHVARSASCLHTGVASRLHHELAFGMALQLPLR